jgi:DNA-binding protein HU-beta
MNKTELVQAIAEKAGLTKVQAKAALDASIEAVEGALKKGDKVALIGFGTFQVIKKDAREGINPATKAKIKIPAKKVVKFKAGAELAAKVDCKKCKK